MGIKIVMVAVNDVDKHVLGTENEILYIKSFLHTGTFERCITICLVYQQISFLIQKANTNASFKGACV